MESRIFEGVISNHYFTFEIGNNLIYTPQCYRENWKSTNTGHLDNDKYYEHDCKHSMKNTSHKYTVNEKIVHKAKENMDQEVNRK